MLRIFKFVLVSCLAFPLLPNLAQAAKALDDKDVINDINCTIRESGTSLNCIWLGHEKRSMTSDDVAAFIDQASVFSYLTVKSRRGMERTFQPDPNAPSFKKLSDIRRNGSISEISRAKLDLFAEIEKKVIKLSDTLDAQAAQADLVKFDASITGDKYKKELKELEPLRDRRDVVCAASPQFEALSRSNQNLQASLAVSKKELENMKSKSAKELCEGLARNNSNLETALSNVLVAFQTPSTCMENFKVSKDKDGSVDLSALSGVGGVYKDRCKVK